MQEFSEFDYSQIVLCSRREEACGQINDQTQVETL